jgi:hypothetical protein
MTMQLKFNRDHGEPKVLRYETNADARVREHLTKGPQKLTDEQVDDLLIAFHTIGRARAQLGIKPGEPE